MICQRLADRTLLIEVDVLGEALGAQHRPEGEDDAGNRPEAEQREHPTRVRAVPESEEFGDDLPRLGQGETPARNWTAKTTRTVRSTSLTRTASALKKPHGWVLAV